MCLLSRSRQTGLGNIDRVENSRRQDLPGIATEFGDEFTLQMGPIAVTEGTRLSQLQQQSRHGHQKDTVQAACCCKIAT